MSKPIADPSPPTLDLSDNLRLQLASIANELSTESSADVPTSDPAPSLVDNPPPPPLLEPTTNGTDTHDSNTDEEMDPGKTVVKQASVVTLTKIKLKKAASADLLKADKKLPSPTIEMAEIIPSVSEPAAETEKKSVGKVAGFFNRIQTAGLNALKPEKERRESVMSSQSEATFATARMSLDTEPRRDTADSNVAVLPVVESADKGKGVDRHSLRSSISCESCKEYIKDKHTKRHRATTEPSTEASKAQGKGGRSQTVTTNPYKHDPQDNIYADTSMALEHQLVCGLCMQVVPDSRGLPCGHVYCYPCMIKLLEDQDGRSRAMVRYLEQQRRSGPGWNNVNTLGYSTMGYPTMMPHHPSHPSFAPWQAPSPMAKSVQEDEASVANKNNTAQVDVPKTKPAYKVPNKRRLWFRVAMTVASILGLGLGIKAYSTVWGWTIPLQDTLSFQFLLVLAAVTLLINGTFLVMYIGRRYRGWNKLNIRYVLLAELFMFLFWMSDVAVLVVKNTCSNENFCGYYSAGVFFAFLLMFGTFLATLWDAYSIYLDWKHRKAVRQRERAAQRAQQDTP
jgi:hypothetical protein